MKKTMTLNLPAHEMEMLEKLAASMDMTKTAVMRKALRVLDMVEGRIVVLDAEAEATLWGWLERRRLQHKRLAARQ